LSPPNLLAQTVVTPLYGKLGDLYGRKRVLQAAVVIFLAGSALCGLTRTLTQLIVFRFVQGLGGGGLMVTAQAVVGDVVPPRERGRYQGFFGAMFGVASIAGPLIGGFFTTHLTWRWIFYVNLPLGAAALAVIAAALPASSLRARHQVDYAGAAPLALALSAAVLVTDLGGTLIAWSSPTMLGLAALTIAGFAGFLAVERRASEPVMPLRLFRARVFSIASAIGFIVGFALFGATTYLPLFLQMSKGSSPTASGLQMLPMMGGMLLTSIGSGQIISRTGRYRLFPIVGTALIALALVLLSRIDAETPTSTVMVAMLLLGLGLGCVMQVLVIATQNAVGYADLGVATSAATLARLVGGSLGTAVLGAIFAANLPAEFHGMVTPASLAGLPAAERAPCRGCRGVARRDVRGGRRGRRARPGARLAVARTTAAGDHRRGGRGFGRRCGKRLLHAGGDGITPAAAPRTRCARRPGRPAQARRADRPPGRSGSQCRGGMGADPPRTRRASGFRRAGGATGSGIGRGP
jgi:EmrB/QacA subfamily drug resistance transporter